MTTTRKSTVGDRTDSDREAMAARDARAQDPFLFDATVTSPSPGRRPTAPWTTTDRDVSLEPAAWVWAAGCHTQALVLYPL
jgi:hypothetical protein